MLALGQTRRFFLHSARRGLSYFWAHLQALSEGLRAFCLASACPAFLLCSFSFFLLSRAALLPARLLLELGWAACALAIVWSRRGEFRLRVWPARLFFSRLLSWLLLGWPTFCWQEDVATAEELAASAGWPEWGLPLYCLLGPILLAWLAGEARANLRPKGSRHSGVAQRLTYVLERYPFFWGLGCLPVFAPLLGWSQDTRFFLWLLAGAAAGEASSNRVFYIDPLEAAEDWLYSAV